MIFPPSLFSLSSNVVLMPRLLEMKYWLLLIPSVLWWAQRTRNLIHSCNRLTSQIQLGITNNEFWSRPGQLLSWKDSSLNWRIGKGVMRSLICRCYKESMMFNSQQWELKELKLRYWRNNWIIQNSKIWKFLSLQEQIMKTFRLNLGTNLQDNWNPWCLYWLPFENSRWYLWF